MEKETETERKRTKDIEKIWKGTGRDMGRNTDKDS